ncbi:Mur ligase family protein [Runella sp. MFBS21]|uniref:UDP-N-acetylmuramate--L-alanine ligase n=1 Tax=Runella sp. MFBS21 TaxID=3034018 RepID=UPI0023FA072D|nr:Mur ligase family protein [Runella sp. MFBS21]MDF7818458.1 Mur ligase family protein [Runella sp. MFBS21]
MQVHFIAIGGSVMHNLAIALHRKGYQVTGSDDEIYDPARTKLQKLGLLPAEIGWFPEKIHSNLDAVILGMHARKDNPELARAQELGLAIYSYPEYIYQQSLDKQRVVIAGSHGKTTITSMVLHALRVNQRQFDYLVGAQLDGFETMVKLSDEAPLIVVEGDEYPASPTDLAPKFLHYHPHIALISGIAWDHYNVFPTWESYVKQFEQLADSLPKSGVLIFDETDDMLDVIGKNERVDIRPVPYEVHAHKIVNGQTFLITTNYGDVPLLVFGEHNMKNISGALAVCEELGLTTEQFYRAIQTFKGASNRMETLGKNEHTAVFKDFAHAPSKVEATTKAAKSQFPERKLIACVELHTFSSLNKDFIGQYAHKLDAADTAIVYYNPHTLTHKRLAPIEPADVKAAFKLERLEVFTDVEALQQFLLSQSWQNANLLMMSSGTFGGLDLKTLTNDILKS